MTARTRRNLSAIAAATILLVAATALAQNWRLTPRFGTVTLRSGFSPSPHAIDVTAGGPLRATQGGCESRMPNAPSVRLYYEAGDRGLSFTVRSAADTALLVITPGRRWLCDEDGGEGNTPLLQIPAPRSGQYDIFVGTADGSTASATLIVRELHSSFSE